MPTKVRLVKAMVFPVVMYGCESSTVKKAERRRVDASFIYTILSEPITLGYFSMKNSVGEQISTP